MNATAPQDITQRAVAGAKALLVRSLYGQGLRVISSLCLARLLYPQDYGVFGVVAFLTGLSLYLGDVGLSAALVRQKREPDRDELFTVFVCQQIFTTAILAVMLVSAGPMVAAFGLSPATTTLLRAMSFGLFLSSLRIVPMLMLERAVRFDAIARCELIESVALTASTIALAAAGAGPWALAGGGLIRGVVGLVCVWTASPWRPGGRFRPAVVGELIRFGLPFQLNALVPVVLGGWMPVLVGRGIGAAALGLAHWAGNMASIPASLAGAVTRVAFPAFSRLQDHPEELARTLEVAVVRIAAIMTLLSAVAALSSPWIIPTVFGQRWMPAVGLIKWFSVALVLTSIIGVLASAQSATGRVSDRLAVATACGVLTWGVAYFAIRALGLTGVGVTSFAMAGFELLLTCKLLAWRGVVDGRFLRRTLVRTAGPLLFAGAGFLAQFLMPADSRPWAQALVGVGVYLLLSAAAELFDPSRPLTAQVVRSWQQYRSMSTGTAASTA